MEMNVFDFRVKVAIFPKPSPLVVFLSLNISKNTVLLPSKSPLCLSIYLNYLKFDDFPGGFHTSETFVRNGRFGNF